MKGWEFEDVWPAGLAVLCFALCLAAGIGWILNLVAIANWTQGTGMLILRVIGVFLVPVGAVLGWV